MSKDKHEFIDYHRRDNLDESLKFDLDQSKGSELAYLIHLRLLNFEEWIHRPFLYYVLEQPSFDPLLEMIMPLAQKCLELCVKIQRMTKTASESGYHYEGSWLEARRGITRGFLLLMASISNKIELPEGWGQAIIHAEKTAKLWPRHGRDLELRGCLLEDLFEGIVDDGKLLRDTMDEW
jgi:hypothetical protein